VAKSKDSITELRALIQQKDLTSTTKSQLFSLASQAELKLSTCTKAEIAILILKNLH
jgi:hypothetical protein